MPESVAHRPGLTRSRSRISKEEAAERMLDVALDDIREHGLFVNMEHLSFEEVIREAGVARSAAYRAWASKELFFRDLFLRLLGSGNPGGHAFHKGTARFILETALSKLELLTSADGRREVFVEVCRIGAEHNFRHLYQSPEWQTYVAVAATLGSIDDTDLQVQAQSELLRAEEAFVSRMSAFYEIMSQILGFNLRPGVTTETVAVLGGSIIQGLALEGSILARQIPDAVEKADPFHVGVEQEWSVPSIGFTAMLVGLTEFSEDHPVDLDDVRNLLESVLSSKEFNSDSSDQG